ncbi:MAG: alpha/beta hydrolase [Actinobacteria bacterium]|nr:alpha/beta hydrolase [Actinomycetota bacterium]
MTFTALADGTRVRYTKRGNAGPTFVLVHGWKQSHRLFDRVTNDLARDSTVLAYDQRGMGESDKPDCAYDFATMAADLGELLDAFNLENVCLVGWSMGCTTALQLVAGGHPRLGRVVLVNGPLRLTKTEGFPYALEPAELAGYVDRMEETWPREELGFYEESLLPENRFLAGWLEQVGRQTPLDVALKLVRQQGTIDHREVIEQAGIPVLAAYSCHDPYWPVDLAEWIAGTARRGSVHVFERSAHCAPLEESEEFCRVLRGFAADAQQ